MEIFGRLYVEIMGVLETRLTSDTWLRVQSETFFDISLLATFVLLQSKKYCLVINNKYKIRVSKPALRHFLSLHLSKPHGTDR